MKMKLLGLLILLWVVPQHLLAGDTHKQDPPMVISMSWSSPDTRYLKQHIGQWEQRPFTGTTVQATWPQQASGSVQGAGNDPDSLSWSAFYLGKRFTSQMLEGPTKDLQQTRFTSSKDNFLWVVSYLRGGYFDWFDDDRWSMVLHNIEGLARLAKEGQLRGLMLDCEEYGTPFWSYGGTRPNYALKNKEAYKGKSWQQTRDQVRQRGRSFIKAINKGFPGCLMWLTYGYSHIVHKLPAGTVDLSDTNNNLYAAFLDGMLEASDDKTIFVDGGEGAYRFHGREEFIRLRRIVTETALKYTLVPEIYQKKMRVGFGLYMDQYNASYKGTHPWYGDRPNDNYMTPANLQKALKNAIEISDGYVWIYSEYPSWWLDGPDATFGEGVRSRDDHKWIDKVYWHAIKKAMVSAYHKYSRP